jgi:toxin ParE1/3/4
LFVRWLPRPIVEREAQLSYIAKDNLRAAIEQGDRIQTAIDRLADFPKAGRVGRRPRTRELVITGTPFVAIYRIDARTAEIHVLRLLHGAQRWPPRP